MKLTNLYFKNLINSNHGDNFLKALVDANIEQAVHEDLKNAMKFLNDDSKESIESRKNITAEFLYDEYKKGTLRIPESILNEYLDYNTDVISPKSDRKLSRYLMKLLLRVLDSQHGAEFERIIMAKNNLKFQQGLLKVKAKVLQNSIEKTVLEYSEHHIIELHIAIADYLISMHDEGNLHLPKSAIEILDEVDDCHNM